MTKLDLYKQKLKERYNLDEYKGGSMPQLGQARQQPTQQQQQDSLVNESGPAAVREDRSVINSPGIKNHHRGDLSVHHDDVTHTAGGRGKVQQNNASDIINSIGQNQNKNMQNKDDYAKELQEQMVSIALRKKKEKE